VYVKGVYKIHPPHSKTQEKGKRRKEGKGKRIMGKGGGKRKEMGN